MLKLRIIFPNVDRFYRNIATTSSKRISDAIYVHRDTSENNPSTPFEFTDANKAVSNDDFHVTGQRLQALIKNYPEGCQRSALGGALDLVQRQIGWVPISAMHKVAELLKVPRMRVYEFATFYTMYKRNYPGKYQVKVCSTTPCMIRGAEDILRAAEEACCCCAGHVSEDGKFGVEIVECAGACANAPVMIVDDDYYEDLTVCDVNNIIQTIRCGRTPPPGPQSGRFAAEPISGLTTLNENPPPPGFGLQNSLLDKASSGTEPKNPCNPCNPCKK